MYIGDSRRRRSINLRTNCRPRRCRSSPRRELCTRRTTPTRSLELDLESMTVHFFNSRLATPPPFAHPLDLDSRLCVRVRVCVGTIFDRKTLAAMTVTTTSGKLDGQLDLPPPELPQLGHKSEQKTSSEEKDKEKSKKDKKDKKEKKRDKERNEEGESRDSRHHHHKHQDDGSEDKPRRHSEDDRREKHSDDRNDRDRNRHRDPDRRDRDREHGREHDRDRDRPRRDRSRSRSRERHHEKKSERDRSRSPRR